MSMHHLHAIMLIINDRQVQVSVKNPNEPCFKATVGFEPHELNHGVRIDPITHSVAVKGIGDPQNKMLGQMRA